MQCNQNVEDSCLLAFADHISASGFVRQSKLRRSLTLHCVTRQRYERTELFRLFSKSQIPLPLLKVPSMHFSTSVYDVGMQEDPSNLTNCTETVGPKLSKLCTQAQCRTNSTAKAKVQFLPTTNYVLDNQVQDKFEVPRKQVYS